MNNEDTRWEQRLNNYSKALLQLSQAVALLSQRELSLLEKQGLIQVFEFTHELAWNVMKDYFKDQGNTLITGSKDAAREAFKSELVKDGDIWMDMIRSRNLTSHTYNKDVTDSIIIKVQKKYLEGFIEFEKIMLSKKS